MTTTIAHDNEVNENDKLSALPLQASTACHGTTKTIHLRDEVITKEEGRPSGWKDGLARSFMHYSTQHLLAKEGFEASG